MNVSVVWLDSEHARLFQFSEDKMERETIHAKRLPLDDVQLEKSERNSGPLYDQLVGKLLDTHRILILGPEIAGTHFLNYLRKNHPLSAKKVIACEPSDHPSDQQIAAYAMKYFQKPVFK